MTGAQPQDTTNPSIELTDSEQAMAESMINAIQRPRKGDIEERGPDGWLPQLDLPGFGDEGDDCGEEIPHFCEHCGNSFDVGRTCAKSMCKRCAPAWILNRAGTSREDGNDVAGHVAKLDATARMMSNDDSGSSIKTHHVVFSPPMHDWHLEANDPLDRTFKVIRELLQIAGAEGYVNYHPYAGNDEQHDDLGEWKRRLFNDRDWEGDVRSELVPRGHFHAVICAEEFPGGNIIKKVNAETGWVIKRITKRGSKKSLDGLQDIARAVTYTLSHTGVDTSGENNYAQYRAYGSTLDSVQYCPRKDEADAAVRSVVPRTLGIPSEDVNCKNEVAPENASDEDVDLLDALDEDDLEDGSSSTEDDVDEVDLIECDGRVLPIGEAEEFVEDPEWLADAPFAQDLRNLWREWTEDDDEPPDQAVDPPPFA